jgi:secernin
MGSDMVVALGRATGDGQTLFGHNNSQGSSDGVSWLRVPGRHFATGEAVALQHLELPQVRHTATVLACRTGGDAGYDCGVNEHGVAVGIASLRTRLAEPQRELLGPELVRLALERADSARHALEILTTFIARHGQASTSRADARDCAFLLADATEAFVLQCAGRFWAYQEVLQTRAVSDGCLIRQDWDRIAPGLSCHAIEAGWWPEDGSKLDFAALVPEDVADEEPSDGLRRWGRATALLELHEGQLDEPHLRRILGDHYEGTLDVVDPLTRRAGPAPLCRHAAIGNTGGPAATSATTASCIFALGRATGMLRLAWCAFGPPCTSVYFPLCLAGDLPPAFMGGDGDEPSLAQRQARLVAFASLDPPRWRRTRDVLRELQARFDHDAGEFLHDATPLAEADLEELSRQTSLFHEHLLELYLATWDQLMGRAHVAASAAVAVKVRSEEEWVSE